MHQLQLHALPVDLIKGCLEYVEVHDILTGVMPTCKAMAFIVREALGTEEQMAVDEETLSGLGGPRISSLGSSPSLSKRYFLVRERRKQYDLLTSTNSDMLIEGNKTDDPVSDETGPTVAQAMTHLCEQTKLLDVKLQELVVPDDDEVQDFVARRQLENSNTCTFRFFCELANKVTKIHFERESFLLDHFNITETFPNGKVNGELTPLGKETCQSVFVFFDIDLDGHLDWAELSAINEAAGLPLSQSAFHWVQRTYETNAEGNLSAQGYQEMFRENFVRVPRLMYKDLVKLQTYIKVNASRRQQVAGESLQRHRQRISEAESQPQHTFMDIDQSVHANEGSNNPAAELVSTFSSGLGSRRRSLSSSSNSSNTSDAMSVDNPVSFHQRWGSGLANFLSRRDSIRRSARSDSIHSSSSTTSSVYYQLADSEDDSDIDEPNYPGAALGHPLEAGKR